MLRYLLIILSSLCASVASAHPISLSSAVINVKSDVVEVELEIMLEDLVLYHKLVANGQMQYAADDLRKAAQAHQTLLLEWFSVLDADGQRLKGTVQSHDAQEIDEQGTGQTELMKRVVRYQLKYALSVPPKFLTFMQKMGGETSVLPAVMDLHILKDSTVADKPTQIFFGRPHTTELDWSQRTGGKRLSMSELRALREQQKKARLGLASYTGLYSFLYITRFEVRHEILIPLVTLEQWLPIPRRDKDFLDVDEQQQAKPLIEKFFKEKSKVLINEQIVEAQLSRFNVFGLDINDFALNAPPRRINMAQARLGVILTFPARATPQAVEVNWSTFSEHAPYIHSIILAGSADPVAHDFQSLDETYKWKGDLGVPQANPVPVPVNKSATELKPPMQVLLRNIYSAFEHREDAQIYDALATSVDGALLKELYLYIKRSLILAEQGGAISHVKDVDVVDVKAVGTDSYEITWKLSAETEHWGHVHLRTSQYRARLSMIKADKFWKLARFQILDEQRLSFETSLRGYD